MNKPLQSRRGFTIVELLIVIVIIGILAAITIVAYNGIQDRARVSSVNSALSQSAKKLKLFQVDNPDTYPAAAGANGIDNLAVLGITNTSDVTYQYSSSANTYCLTATNGTTSYKISSSSATPTAGGCAGHGVGGVAAITNLAINPSGSTAPTYWSTNGGSAAVSRDGAATRPGSLTTGSIKTAFTATAAVSTQLWDGSTTPLVSVSAGESVTISAWVKSATAGRTMTIGHRWRDSANAQISQVTSSLFTLSGNWEQISFTSQAPAGVSYDHISFFFNGQASDNWWVDDVMVTKGTTAYNYADGASTNWVWNGTPHMSTSTGPAS